jgi:glycosyltransferase involved in cell wall biosynthesis
MVPANDDQALADALARVLLDDTLRASMGAAAQNFTRENLTIEKMVQRHSELYLRLLGQKR